MSAENTSYADKNPYKDRKIFNGYDWVEWAKPCNPTEHDCDKCNWCLKEERCITMTLGSDYLGGNYPAYSYTTVIDKTFTYNATPEQRKSYLDMIEHRGVYRKKYEGKWLDDDIKIEKSLLQRIMDWILN